MSAQAVSLAGRVALVTGASRRVGRAIALALGAAGAEVIVHYRRDRAAAEAVVAELGTRGQRASAIAADLASPDAPRALVVATLAAHGRLDILVNSAGPFDRVPFVGGDDAAWEAAWRASLDVTVLAPARLARAAAGALGAHATPGVIVNLLDIAAWQAWPSYAHHGAAKAALAHLTRTLAVALAPRVRCVGVAPGIVDWPADLDAAARERLVARVPLGRAGTPQDVAGAVTYLCGADYVTGSVITVDGGRLAATGEGG